MSISNSPPVRTLRPLRAARALLALAASACTPIGAYNVVASGDPGSRAIARNVPFGEKARHRLDIYAPTGPVSGAPVIVFFYGGSWNSGRREDYAFAGRALAAMGYVTVVPDYGLAPAVVFPEFLEDGAKAVAWTARNIARHGGDPRRLALVGHSAGAYNAAMLALDARFLTQERVDPAIVRAFVGLAGPYDFKPLALPVGVATFGHFADLEQTQPVNFVRSNAPATLLAVGLDDETVVPANSYSLEARLKAKGAEVELKRYPGLDHVDMILGLPLLTRHSRKPLAQDVAAFLGRHLAADGAGAEPARAGRSMAEAGR